MDNSRIFINNNQIYLDILTTLVPAFLHENVSAVDFEKKNIYFSENSSESKEQFPNFIRISCGMVRFVALKLKQNLIKNSLKTYLFLGFIYLVGAVEDYCTSEFIILFLILEASLFPLLTDKLGIFP